MPATYRTGPKPPSPAQLDGAVLTLWAAVVAKRLGHQSRHPTKSALGVVQNVPFSGNTGNRWSFDGKGIFRFRCYPDLNHTRVWPEPARGGAYPGRERHRRQP